MSSNSYYQQEAGAPQQYHQQEAGAPQQYHQQQPSAPPRPGDDSSLLPTGSERTEQVEQLQSYEASKAASGAPENEDDKNRETLQREFPKIDGSLIAAIYGDSNSLSATREMLYELSMSDQGQ